MVIGGFRLPFTSSRPRRSSEPVDRVELGLSRPWKAVTLALCLSLTAGTGVSQAATLEQQLQDGQTCQHHMLRRNARGDDATQQQRIEKLEPVLRRHAHRTELDYTVTLTRGHGMYAAACGNGSLFLDQELSGKLDEGELLFTGAHELGHTELGHQADHRDRRDALGWRLLLPVRKYADQLDAVGRTNELAADCFAVGVLKQEGYGPETAASALKKILHGVEAQGHDHPSLQTRLDNLGTCR